MVGTVGDILRKKLNLAQKTHQEAVVRRTDRLLVLVSCVILMSSISSAGQLYPPEGYGKWDRPAKEGEYHYDPFESMIELWFNRKTKTTGFYVEKKHCNGSMTNVHGGMLATLADASLFAASADVLNGPSVTIQLNITYVSSARIGQWVEAKGDVDKCTKSLVFVTGKIFVKDSIIATYTGIIKKLKPEIESKSNL